MSDNVPQIPAKTGMPKTTKIVLAVVASLLVVCVVCACGAGLIGALGKGSTSANANATNTTGSTHFPPVKTPAGTPKPTTPPKPTATPKPVFAHFGDGMFQVGKDIQPGTYRTREGSTGCYWARLKGFDGSVDSILANDNTDDPAIVTIASTDKGFESQDCGTWTADLSQITTSKTSFGDGMFIVGTDIAPGTYKSAGVTGCYWARLANFSGGVGSINANDNTDVAAIVTIRSSDKGFQSKGCGPWNKV